MIVRIRLHRRQSAGAVNRQAALMASTLMTPLAVMAWALAGWRLAADLEWTGAFAIQSGIFSHWQIWVAVGIVLQFAAFLLLRFSGRDSGSGTALR